MVNKIRFGLLIESGGGTGPVMPGNPLKRDGANSCGTIRFREIGREYRQSPSAIARRGFFLYGGFI